MRSGFANIGSCARAAGAFALLSLALARTAAAAEGGLVLLPDWGMLALLLVVFAVLIVPVNKLLFQPIFHVLAERDRKIAGTRKRAEQLVADADTALERYQTAIAEVRGEAEQERRGALDEARRAHAARTSEARARAESEIGRARDELAAALSEARGSLRSQSQGLAREIASRVLGRELT